MKWYPHFTLLCPFSLAKTSSHPTPCVYVCVRMYKAHLSFLVLKSMHFTFLSINNIYICDRAAHTEGFYPLA
jgi:hypothetical protein